MLDFRGHKDRIIGLLTGQVADLQVLLERQQRDHAAQIKDLTDKLVACSNPYAFRALTVPSEPRERSTAPPPRANLPGHRPDTRPGNATPPGPSAVARTVQLVPSGAN